MAKLSVAPSYDTMRKSSKRNIVPRGASSKAASATTTPTMSTKKHTTAMPSPVRDRTLARQARPRPWRCTTMKESTKDVGIAPSSGVLQVEKKKGVVRKSLESMKRVLSGERRKVRVGAGSANEKADVRRTTVVVDQKKSKINVVTSNKAPRVGLELKKDAIGATQIKVGDRKVVANAKTRQVGQELKNKVDAKVKSLSYRALACAKPVTKPTSSTSYCPTKPAGLEGQVDRKPLVYKRPLPPRLSRAPVRLPAGARDTGPGGKVRNHWKPVKSVPKSCMKTASKKPASKKVVHFSKRQPRVNTFTVENYCPDTLHKAGIAPRPVHPYRSSMFVTKYSTLRGSARSVSSVSVKESVNGRPYQKVEMERVPRAMTLSNEFIKRFKAVRRYVEREPLAKGQKRQFTYGNFDCKVRIDLETNVSQKDLFSRGKFGDSDFACLSGMFKTIRRVPWVVAKIHKNKPLPSLESITSIQPAELFGKQTEETKRLHEFDLGLYEAAGLSHFLCDDFVDELVIAATFPEAMATDEVAEIFEDQVLPDLTQYAEEDAIPRYQEGYDNDFPNDEDFEEVWHHDIVNALEESSHINNDGSAWETTIMSEIEAITRSDIAPANPQRLLAQHAEVDDNECYDDELLSVSDVTLTPVEATTTSTYFVDSEFFQYFGTERDEQTSDYVHACSPFKLANSSSTKVSSPYTSVSLMQSFSQSFPVHSIHGPEVLAPIPRSPNISHNASHLMFYHSNAPALVDTVGELIELGNSLRPDTP